MDFYILICSLLLKTKWENIDLLLFICLYYVIIVLVFFKYVLWDFERSSSPASQQGALTLHQRSERSGWWEIWGVPGCGPPHVPLQQRFHDYILRLKAQHEPTKTNCVSLSKTAFLTLTLFRPLVGYQQAKTVELQQRSSSVATQQTTVSSIPSHPSTTGVSHTS